MKTHSIYRNYPEGNPPREIVVCVAYAGPETPYGAIPAYAVLVVTGDDRHHLVTAHSWRDRTADLLDRVEIIDYDESQQHEDRVREAVVRALYESPYSRQVGRYLSGRIVSPGMQRVIDSAINRELSTLSNLRRAPLRARGA